MAVSAASVCRMPPIRKPRQGSDTCEDERDMEALRRAATMMAKPRQRCDGCGALRREWKRGLVVCAYCGREL